jgi:hypothetical protein
MRAASRRSRHALPIVAAWLLASPLASPHHSGAMFDSGRTVTLQGTVKAFQWTNPHCFIQLVVAGAEGPREWSIELGSPGQLYRNGWRPTSVRPGEALQLQIHPLRDGSAGGGFVSATTADGQVVGAARPARTAP